jgi:hypothetical protein
LLEIYNYLCGPALELKLFTKKKKLEGSTPKIMLSMQAVPPTTEKVMDVFLSSDSTDFILIDFRLLDYL